MVFTLTGLSCLLLSGGTGVYMFKACRFSFEKRSLHLYYYIMLLLLASGLFGRALFFTTTIGLSEVQDWTRMVCLLWSWPLCCQQLAVYILSQRWAFDVGELGTGYENIEGRREFRRAFKGLIMCILGLVVMLYLFFLFSLPSNTKGLAIIYFCQELAFTSWLVCVVLLIVALCGPLKDLRSINA